jgi:ankyrin repeat protein
MNITPFEIAHFFGYESQLLDKASEGYIQAVKKIQLDKLYCYGEREKAIITATSKGYFDIVDFFIKEGVAVNAENNTALIHASRLGKFNIAEILLKNGANAQAKNNLAIQMAALYGHLDIVKLLIEFGSALSFDNNIVARLASDKGHFDIVYYCHLMGVDVLDIKTAIDATRHDNVKMLLYMQRYGFNLEDYDFLLTLACFNGSIDVMEYLLSCQNDLNKFFLLKVTKDRPLAKNALNEYIKKIEYYVTRKIRYKNEKK